MAVDFGNVPQWITTGIAATAGWLAYTSLQSQRVIARRRAAFDMFLKTETDEKMLTAFDKFHAGIQAMKKASSVEADKEAREHYFCIRKYLNIHELIAVGLREEVLDADVVYFYWGNTLTNHYSDAKPVLDFLAKREKNKYTYADLHELNAKWVARKAKATG